MPTSAVDRAPGHPGLTGLVLTGGGARAAYQVGVLQAVLDILDPRREPGFSNPFHVVCGTSAGAINAAALACRADRPHVAMRRIRRLWEALRTHHVYRSDALGLLDTGSRWLGMLMLGWLFPSLRERRPRSLLDNQPLAELLARVLDFDRLDENLATGVLSSLAITASGYTSGEHVTFYQARRTIDPWRRSLRQAIAARIGVDHLMASSAIPFVFPARALDVRGQVEWCGDGSMRQLAPISPAIHLGAARVLVIGTGYRDETHPEQRRQDPPYPSLAQIGGHALSSIFLDSISADVERLERANQVLSLAGSELGQRTGLRHVDVLALGPSRSLDQLALEHLASLPRTSRALFRVLGVSSDPTRPAGGSLMSYLLFEASYTRQLIELGYADTMQRTDEVKAFFKEASS